jgi:hypothetical protein
MARFSG